eukprot:3641844-Rhodomonas_salina.1
MVLPGQEPPREKYDVFLVETIAYSELWVLRLGSSTEQKQLRPVVSRITEGAEEEGNVIVVCGVL